MLKLKRNASGFYTSWPWFALQDGVPVQAGVSLAQYSTPVLWFLIGSKKLTPPTSPLTDPAKRFSRLI